MTRTYIRKIWPSVDEGFEAIAQTQAPIANPDFPIIDPDHPYLPLTLEGRYYDPLKPGKVSLIDKGMIRTVRIVTGQPTLGRTFEVTGYQNGVLVKEELPGNNNEFIIGTQPYDEVVSVNMKGTAIVGIEFSVGLGLWGYFPLIQVNTSTNLSGISYGINLIPNKQNIMPVYLLNTYSNIWKNGRTLQSMYEDGKFSVLLDDNADPLIVDSTQAIALTGITNYLILAVNNDPDIDLNEDETISWEFIYMQL